MVFHHISEDIKNRALWLLDNDYIPEDVCEILGVSRRSLYRWKRNQAEFGSVIPPHSPFQGRPRTLNADQTHDLFTLLQDSPEMFLDEIQDWIAVSHDVPISRTALHQLICDAGITYKMLQKAASERDEAAREEWREFVRNNLVASMMITADESSKDGRTIFRKRGRAPEGQHPTMDADFVRGDRYSIMAAISIDGYVGTRVVQGSVDADEFFDFIVEDIVGRNLIWSAII